MNIFSLVSSTKFFSLVSPTKIFFLLYHKKKFFCFDSTPKLQSTRMVSQWPRMVSVAWKHVSSEATPPPIDMIVKPIDFQISEESAKIHGITQEKALRKGVPIDIVFKALTRALTPKVEGEPVVVCCYNSQVGDIIFYLFFDFFS